MCPQLLKMGSSQSSDKLHCNRYLSGQGPPSLQQQGGPQTHLCPLCLTHSVTVHSPVLPVCAASEQVSSSQPKGQMTWVILHRDLPGFPQDNTVQINYIFPDGVQTVSISVRVGLGVWISIRIKVTLLLYCVWVAK